MHIRFCVCPFGFHGKNLLFFFVWYLKPSIPLNIYRWNLIFFLRLFCVCVFFDFFFYSPPGDAKESNEDISFLVSIYRDSLGELMFNTYLEALVCWSWSCLNLANLFLIPQKAFQYELMMMITCLKINDVNADVVASSQCLTADFVVYAKNFKIFNSNCCYFENFFE